MRKFALVVNRVSKLTIVATCLSFAFGHFTAVYATNPVVSMPSNVVVGKNEVDAQFPDDFDISGFSESETILVSVAVSDGSFSIWQTNGINLEYGYWSWTNVSSVSFTGNKNAANAALDSLTYSSSGSEGTPTLTVSAQIKESGTFFYEGNGNIYEYVPYWGISYSQAKIQAAGYSLNGMSGHLVTITSAGEQDFVNSKIQNASNIWIALSDATNEGIWRVDSGPENGTTVWTSSQRLSGAVNDQRTSSYWDSGITALGQYSNWCGGEPNNSDWGNAGEDHAVTNWNGDSCWNDLSGNNVWSISGFVVEYEAAMQPGVVSTGTMTINVVDNQTTTTTSSTTSTTVEETTTTIPEQTTTVPETTTTVPETTTTTSTTTTTTTTTTTRTTEAPVIAPPVFVAPDEDLEGEAPETPTTPNDGDAEITEDQEPVDSGDSTDEQSPVDEQPSETVDETTPESVPVDDEAEANTETDSGIDESEAAELASDEEFINSATQEQAEEVFSAINEDALTDEEAAAIVAAVQNAPLDVREVFEDVVDLFQGAFDDYFMIDSNISVGQRRTVIAVGAMTIAVSSAPIGRTAGGSGGMSITRENNSAARREDDEQEVVGEVAGDGLNWIKSIRIFKNVDGVMKMDWKAFGKKFVFGIMNMGFTLVGSLIVYLTLSGTLQQIAGVATVMAFAAAMWLHMLEPDQD
jgi:hypothetical protein